jgi:CRP-like cAMP-binding protein
MCPVWKAGFCECLARERAELVTQFQQERWLRHDEAKPSQVVVGRGERCDHVCVLCEGWAFRLIQLADGRRQVLSVLLPGDLFSISTVFESQLHFSVQALTHIAYARFDREQVHARALSTPTTSAKLASICTLERMQADELATVLGRRSAEERIAHVILQVVQRLRPEQAVIGERYRFPLRQQHIADMTGLTPVYVSQILKSLRESGLLDLSHGILTILNRPELERIARLA